MDIAELQVAIIQSHFRSKSLRTLKNDPSWKDILESRTESRPSTVCDTTCTNQIEEEEAALEDACNCESSWGAVKRPKPKPMPCYGKGRARTPISELPDFSNIVEFERNMRLLEEASTAEISVGRGRGRGKGRGAQHNSRFQSAYAPDVNMDAIQLEAKCAMGNWRITTSTDRNYNYIRPPRSRSAMESDTPVTNIRSTASSPSPAVNDHNQTFSSAMLSTCATTKLSKTEISVPIQYEKGARTTPIPPPLEDVQPSLSKGGSTSSSSVDLDDTSSSSSFDRQSSRSLPPTRPSKDLALGDNTVPSVLGRNYSSGDIKADFFLSDGLQASPSTHMSSNSLPDYCRGYTSSSTGTKDTPSYCSSSSSVYSNSSHVIKSSSSRELGVGKTITNNCSNNNTATSSATFIPNIRESVSSSNNSQDDNYEEPVAYKSPTHSNCLAARSTGNDWDPTLVYRSGPTTWNKNKEFPVLGQPSCSAAKPSPPDLPRKAKPLSFKEAAEESLGLKVLKPVPNSDDGDDSSEEEEEDNRTPLEILSFISETYSKDKPDTLLMKNIPPEITASELELVLKEYDGEVKKINMVSNGNTQSAEFSIQGVDGSWVADNLNNTTPFLGCKVPITCELFINSIR